jgi:hypothetical protein
MMTAIFLPEGERLGACNAGCLKKSTTGIFAGDVDGFDVCAIASEAADKAPRQTSKTRR